MEFFHNEAFKNDENMSELFTAWYGIIVLKINQL